MSFETGYIEENGRLSEEKCPVDDWRLKIISCGGQARRANKPGLESWVILGLSFLVSKINIITVLLS